VSQAAISRCAACCGWTASPLSSYQYWSEIADKYAFYLVIQAHYNHREMSTLIVDLSHAWRPARAGLDFVLSQDGASLSRQGNAAPALLPVATELIAVVPPQALSWHALRLPEGLKLHARSDATKLRTALIGLMEEQLLADSDTLHLAVFDHPTPQHLWVAVCDATALRAALQVLEDAGRVVHRVVPAYSPASGPADTPALHVSGEGA